MSDLKNPMRFSISNRTVDVANWLRHEGFDKKYVTDIDIRPDEGNIYVHWEVVDDGV